MDNILNIAITGNYGAGKSSVIKTYEKNHIKQLGKPFIHISLADLGGNTKQNCGGEQDDFIGCHQRSDRSFYYKKCQFPICARCTGVIIATIVTVPLFFRIRISLAMSIILSGVMLLDWGIQY